MTVRIPVQWIVDCILNKIIEYDDSLYNIFDEEFNELFDEECSHLDTYFRCRIYAVVRDTVFTMVQNEFEKRRG